MTAVFTGAVRVCINYSVISFNGLPQLFHFENTPTPPPTKIWIDVTTSVDTVHQIVCGVVSSLSPFAIFQRTPACVATATASPDILWPPNHKMRHVTIAVTPAPSCTAPVACTIESVASNEPVNGTGDGDTAPDWTIAGDRSLDLRAGGKPLAMERFAIEPKLRNPASPARLGRFRYFCTFYVCQAGRGPLGWLELESQLGDLAGELSRPGEVLWGVSALSGCGLVIRGVAVKGRDLSCGLVAFWRGGPGAGRDKKRPPLARGPEGQLDRPLFHFIFIVGSPNRIHERRTSGSVTTCFARAAASPTVTALPPNNRRYSS